MRAGKAAAHAKRKASFVESALTPALASLTASVTKFAPQHSALITLHKKLRKGAGAHVGRMLTKRSLSDGALQALAFPDGPFGSLQVCAGYLKLAPSTVHYARQGIAAAVMVAQHNCIQQLLRMLRGRELVCIVNKLKWDETSQSVTIARRAPDNADVSVRRPTLKRRPKGAAY
jgi:hypothetical protein